MAILTITGASQSGVDRRGQGIVAPQMPPTEDQSIVIGATSTQSVPFNGNTYMVRVNCDVNCCLAFGANPVAFVGFHRLGANETGYYTVRPGDMLAVISSPT